MKIDWSKVILHEKVDGSLIKIYCWRGTWYISTRGTAFAESGVNGWDITFKELVLKALDCKDDREFQMLCYKHLNEWSTYICEVTAIENRVVTRYKGYDLWFLAERGNKTGNYQKYKDTGFPFKYPKKYSFDSIEHCLEVVKSLPDLQEGYVAYEEGVPVCKIKSPTYVAIHRIKGEGLSPKRIAELVCMNEQDEYLAYYPEDGKYFTDYVEKLDGLIDSAVNVFEKSRGIVDQKEFAMKVKDHPLSASIFMARKLDRSVIDCFNNQELNYRIKVLRQEVEG